MPDAIHGHEVRVALASVLGGTFGVQVGDKLEQLGWPTWTVCWHCPPVILGLVYSLSSHAAFPTALLQVQPACPLSQLPGAPPSASRAPFPPLPPLWTPSAQVVLPQGRPLAPTSTPPGQVACCLPLLGWSPDSIFCLRGRQTAAFLGSRGGRAGRGEGGCGEALHWVRLNFCCYFG